MEFYNRKMFGLIDSKGVSFLKVDESNKSDYVEKGSMQHSRMPYYSIPQEVLSNQDELIIWVKKSIEINA
ncbi:MAG: TfoX/Sxy family protein [Cyclobacteriaceae bacterium]